MDSSTGPRESCSRWISSMMTSLTCFVRERASPAFRVTMSHFSGVVTTTCVAASSAAVRLASPCFYLSLFVLFCFVVSKHWGMERKRVSFFVFVFVIERKKKRKKEKLKTKLKKLKKQTLTVSSRTEIP